MREIKFRAWDKIKKEMYYQLDAVDENRTIFWKRWEITPGSDPMQYTGLQDTEGKEIYEGDLCSNEAATWEIIFNKGCFCGKLINSPHGTGTQDTHIALRAIVGLKIIGNIHEIV